MDLPDLGIKLVSPVLQGRFLTLDHQESQDHSFLEKSSWFGFWDIILLILIPHWPFILNLLYWFYLISWLLNFRGCPGSMLEYLSTFTWWSHLISWQEVPSLSSLLLNLCLSFPWTTDSYNTSFARTKSLESSLTSLPHHPRHQPAGPGHSTFKMHPEPTTSPTSTVTLVWPSNSSYLGLLQSPPL